MAVQSSGTAGAEGNLEVPGRAGKSSRKILNSGAETWGRGSGGSVSRMGWFFFTTST